MTALQSEGPHGPQSWKRICHWRLCPLRGNKQVTTVVCTSSLETSPSGAGQSKGWPLRCTLLFRDTVLFEPLTYMIHTHILVDSLLYSESPFDLKTNIMQNNLVVAT